MDTVNDTFFPSARIPQSDVDCFPLFRHAIHHISSFRPPGIPIGFHRILPPFYIEPYFQQFFLPVQHNSLQQNPILFRVLIFHCFPFPFTGSMRGHGFIVEIEQTLFQPAVLLQYYEFLSSKSYTFPYVQILAAPKPSNHPMAFLVHPNPFTKPFFQRMYPASFSHTHCHPGSASYIRSDPCAHMACQPQDEFPIRLLYLEYRGFYHFIF